MKQYLDVLSNVLEHGVEKESGRPNMPHVLGISDAKIKMDLSEGFPLLTTKGIDYKNIVHELLWFLHGDTNIQYLVQNGVNIWNKDAYRWYLKLHKERTGWDGSLSLESFIANIKENHLEATSLCERDIVQQFGPYKLGDLGKVYGHQWRNQNGVDQIKDVFESLRDNPYSRYHVLDAWNKVDFPEMALPPCHLMYQFIVRPMDSYQRENWYYPNSEEGHFPNSPDSHVHMELDKAGVPRFYLDLNMYQRSCDVFLGVPYNLASMSLLLLIFSKALNMVPGVASWNGGHCDIYLPHIPVVKEQLTRIPDMLPIMHITRELNSLEDILSLTIDDFELSGYDPQGKLKAELFTGLKK